MMIERHPELPDPFLLLERKESFADYARTYGDRLAEHYESCGVIVVPHMPIKWDLEFMQQVVFPPEWKKIGVHNGIEEPVIAREGTKLAPNRRNPLVAGMKDMALATYLQAQIASFDTQLRLGLRLLFPRYLSLVEESITWRLTETVDEPMHYDFFDEGKPMRPEWRNRHRLKLFINIDSEPRAWHVSLDLPRLLKRCRAQMPDELPDDLNVLGSVIDKVGVLDDIPRHKIRFPAMSAIIVNAEVVAHEVVYGRRAVAGEYWCRDADMLDPARHTHRSLSGWIAGSGYRVAADPFAVASEYANLAGTYEVLSARSKPRES